MITVREDFDMQIGDSPLAPGSPVIEILQDVEELRSLQPLEVNPIFKLFHTKSSLIVDTDPAFTALDAPSPDVIRVPIARKPGVDPEPVPNVVVLGPGVFLYEMYLDTTITRHINDPLFIGYLGEKPLVLEAFPRAIEAIGEIAPVFSLQHIKNITRVLANEFIIGIVHRRFAPGYYAEIGTISFDYQEELYADTDYTGSLDQFVPASKKADLFNQLKHSYQEAIQTRVAEFESWPPIIIYDEPLK